MAIIKCECDSKQFIVVESYSYRAELEDDGSLCCGKSDGGIDYIECAECGQRYSEGCFKEIIF